MFPNIYNYSQAYITTFAVRRVMVAYLHGTGGKHVLPPNQNHINRPLNAAHQEQLYVVTGAVLVCGVPQSPRGPERHVMVSISLVQSWEEGVFICFFALRTRADSHIRVVTNVLVAYCFVFFVTKLSSVTKSLAVMVLPFDVCEVCCICHNHANPGDNPSHLLSETSVHRPRLYFGTVQLPCSTLILKGLEDGIKTIFRGSLDMLYNKTILSWFAHSGSFLYYKPRKCPYGTISPLQ
ncbi:hypothetical protein EYF80_014201 [Liparis tanakae]|uniref:Uncharacterized protein n=1 Tax=Liparis tanakae TaxID=230148 RepID=A0A4Z2IDD4_9TELE|nr:hypothetical protein EYF80_014201 [Liparis tanakae]